MDWAVDFVCSVDRDSVRFMRDTLEARLKAEQGAYGDAARILWELLIEVRHAHKRDWECMTMVHMGKVYRVLRWAIAAKLFEGAIELADANGFTTAKMMALAELGEMKCQWGKFEESLTMFEQALALAPPQDGASRRSILLDKVMAYEGLDDLERCRELLIEVLAIDQEIGLTDTEDDVDHMRRIQRGLAARGGAVRQPKAARGQ
jgi:tetratricopeptide (TPR) repeat protein